MKGIEGPEIFAIGGALVIIWYFSRKINSAAASTGITSGTSFQSGGALPGTALQGPCPPGSVTTSNPSNGALCIPTVVGPTDPNSVAPGSIDPVD